MNKNENKVGGYYYIKFLHKKTDVCIWLITYLACDFQNSKCIRYTFPQNSCGINIHTRIKRKIYNLCTPDDMTLPRVEVVISFSLKTLVLLRKFLGS